MSTSSDVPEKVTLTPEEAVAHLQQIRDQVMPMLEAVRRQYENRVRPGYPTMVDNVERGGVFGINLDPGFGLYFMTDGQEVYAELHYVSLRTDTLSAANYEKFAGRPVQERHEIDLNGPFQQYRNLVSKLLNRWQTQQTFIYRVDS